MNSTWIVCSPSSTQTYQITHEAGPQNDVNLKNEIKSTSDTGKLWNIYKRPNPGPISDLLSFISCSNGPHIIRWKINTRFNWSCYKVFSSGLYKIKTSRRNEKPWKLAFSNFRHSSYYFWTLRINSFNSVLGLTFDVCMY